MARTLLVSSDPSGSFPADLLATDIGTVIAAPADATASPNGNVAKSTGRDLLIIDNRLGSTRTITVTAAGAPATTISAYSVTGGKISRLGPFPTKGWRFTDGLHINGAHADLLLTVLRLPPIR